MQNVLNLWRMRNIKLEGKIIIFKTLILSKIVYLTLINSFSKQLIEEMQKKQKKPTKILHLEQLDSQNQP